VNGLLGGGPDTTRLELLPPIANADDIRRRVSPLPQPGQICGSLDSDIFSFFSNACPQSRQAKSYIGIENQLP
jgi:hypothetical protein